MVDTTTNRRQLIAELADIRQRISELEQLMIEDERPDQLLQNLFLSSPAATYIAQDGVFRFISPQLRQITGRPESELIGTSPLNLVLNDDKDSYSEQIL